MAPASRPNIVVFMADQLKAPGPNGGYPCPTPNLDGIAAEGISFTQAIVSSPLCSPSRSTFQTGLLPSCHGVHHNVHLTYAHKDLDPGLPTLASVLRGQGYRTAISGVWHISANRKPGEYGYDLVSGEEPELHTGSAQPVRQISLPGDSFSGKETVAAVFENEDGRYGADSEIQTAVGFLEQFAQNKDDPFFLFVSTHIPHVPWRVTQAYLENVPAEAALLPRSFSEDLDGARCPSPFMYNGCDYAYWQRSAEEMQEALRCYYALATKVDEQVGVLCDALRRLGMAEDTLFLFTSDHGEMAGAHNLIGKGFDFYDEVIRVPMIARWPGHIDAGRSVDRVTDFQDIMPTFCEAAGIDTPSACRGQSLAPLFHGDAETPWREMVLVEQYSHVYPGFAVGLRSRDWLYVLNPRHGEQLYDRRNDPDELVNLALDAKNGERVRQWRNRLPAFMREMEHPMSRRVTTTIEYMNMRECGES